MLIGYARVSKADGSQVLDLQIDALIEAGVDRDHIYTDRISGAKNERPGLNHCLRALRQGDTLITWRMDRLGRNLRHLINCVQELEDRKVGFKVLTGAGAMVDTTTAHGKLIFGIFAAMAEYERDLIRERTIAGLKAARARGRVGGRKFRLSKAKVRYLEAAMGKPETVVAELGKELGICMTTLYKYVGPDGQLRDYGRRVLGK